MDSWMVWIVVAVVLFIIELVTPGTFYFFCIGIGAVFAAVATLLENQVITWVVFFVVSIIFVIMSRPIIKKFNSEKTRASNVDELVGKLGKVSEEIKGGDDAGMVKIGGETWLARASEKIEEGGEVQVVKVEGNYVNVEKMVKIEEEK